jgi:hypothetical protein
MSDIQLIEFFPHICDDEPNDDWMDWKHRRPLPLVDDCPACDQEMDAEDEVLSDE